MIDELKYHGVSMWHALGFKGEGINFLELESDNDHCEKVINQFKKIAPRARCFNIGLRYHIKGNEIIRDNIAEIEKMIVDYNIKVLGASMSFNLKNDELINKIAELIKKYNLIFVTAAGNDGIKKDIADLNERLSITTAAIRIDYKNRIKKEWYSTVDDDVDFATLHGQNAGTSFASPTLAGMICLILQRYGDMTQSEMYKVLKDVSIDAGIKGVDSSFGWGVPILPEKIIIPKEVKKLKFAHNPTDNNRITYRFGLTKEYGSKFHNGIDLGAIEPGWSCDKIYSVDDGIVKMMKYDSLEAGMYPIIQHKGYFSRYCHLCEMLVRVGDEVKAGQVIGRMGSTGYSTATHLHLEIKVGEWKDFWVKDSTGKYVNAIDPESMLLTVEEEKLMSDKKTEQEHWANKHWESLNAKGITVSEKRFDDNITRGEIFALLDRLTYKM
ncbi:MAG: peptidoglycan DD-metalloendopeptidase family protein [Candidatus Heimdallarchaeaceae archaeon]